MTTKWNKTGKIKAIVLGLLAMPNLLVPTGSIGQQGLLMILMPLIFANVAIPLMAKFNAALGREIVKPNWNDNPLTFKQPLAMFDFFAYFFLTVGLSILIGTALKFHTLNNLGLTSISLGVGVL
jgi:hypothetical protein